MWVLSSSKQLIAYSATDLSGEVWSANLPGNTRFSIPDVTDLGYVVVGAGKTLVTYALPSAV